MDLRRFGGRGSAGGTGAVCREHPALSAGGIIPRPNWRPGRTGPGASPPSACWTAIPWWQRRKGVCWALGTWSRADIWDCLYTAADSQRRGAAASLCDALEAEARRQGEELLRVEASRTARGFFERRGYQVAAAQLVPVDGEELENFRMAKKLDKTVSHKTNA